jgi:hypothetical protein
MKPNNFSLYAAVCGILAGLAAIGGGLYAHSVQPEFGTPGFFGLAWDQGFSGVGMLVGLGVVMVVGGLLSFKWASLGASIVCIGAMIGLVYTFDRGEWRWVPLLYYWAIPWLLAWLAGIFAGYALHARVEPHGNGGSPAVGAAAPSGAGESA